MTTEPFDVVILGGGNAGIAVTGPVRRAGMSVAMIEGVTRHFLACKMSTTVPAKPPDRSVRLFTQRRHDMCRKAVRAPQRSLVFGGVVAGSFAIASAAMAGECPADKMKPRAREKVDYKPVGVSDVTLGSIDLEKEPAHIEGRELRFRRLTIAPGGIVPWHSHDDRPALIFVQHGEIVEYASNCEVPITHKAGDIRAEVFGTSHWWKNLGKETVVLYVGDVRKDPNDHNM
jgi:quercetin dioxygenase-like cupin family protein